MRMSTLTFRRRTILSGLAASSQGMWLPAAARAAGEAPLVVVVNTDSKLADMSLSTLRAIFSGELVRDPDGARIVPFNDQPGGPARVAFDRLVLRMAPDEIGRFWIDRRIRGQGSPPRAVVPVGLRQQVVARFKEAITYARANEVLSIAKILRVDGKSHLAKDYPLLG
jgi:hypothetical protein